MHIPVLLAETVGALSVKSGGRYLDGTFGRGGHTREILRSGGRVLGIDRDISAIAAGEELAREYAGMLTVARGCHGGLKGIANEHGWKEVDGILLDLGVSSPQLDDAGRGFSFLREGPLDMRMDREGGVNAAEIVNTWSEEELERIFREYGEERQARRIAKAITGSRGGRGGFRSTKDLADFIEKLIGRHGGHHPATRVFQALRMAVNDEIGELERALDGGMELLGKGGRFAVITFESITDRIVKKYFAEHVGRRVSLQQGGEKWEGVEPRAKPVTRKAVTAGETEIKMNPRSRSAKLRVIEKE